MDHRPSTTDQSQFSFGVIAVLEKYPNVVAYFNGHDHDGNYGKCHGIHYLNFKGVVDTADQNAFAIADVYDDRLTVRGFGREPERTLSFA